MTWNSDIANLPIPESASATEMLAGASRRPFTDVLILGVYDDGEIRHVSTLTRKDALWMMRLYEQMLLGLIDGAKIPPTNKEDE